MRLNLVASVPTASPPTAPSRKTVRSSATETQKLSICLNKTCKRQGSQQIAKFVEDLGLPHLNVERTGCQGKCGAGPNMVLSPLNVQLSHVKTVSKMTQILREVGGFYIPDDLLKMTTLRLYGNSLAREGQFEDAIQAYNEALQLDVREGRYLVLSNRAGVLLALGRLREALKDSEEAAANSPPDFHNATYRQVEAHIAMGDRKAARHVLEQALLQSPDLRRSEQFQQLKAEVR